MSRRALKPLLPVLLLFATGAGASGDERDRPPEGLDCKRLGQLRPAGDDGPWESRFLPWTDLFVPAAADPREPRNAASYQRVRLLNGGEPGQELPEFTGGFVSLGTDVGLWGLRQPDGCDGIQLSIGAAVFSQFDLQTLSDDLINSDFLASVSGTFRRGVFSGRARLFHQSSHLGDEYLVNNPEAVFSELSIDGVDLTAAWEGPFWKLYSGAGYLLRSTLDRPWLFRGGLELYGPALRGRGTAPSMGSFLSTHFELWEAREWGPTVVVVGGVELGSRSSTQRLRAGILFMRGVYPYGRFFLTEEVQSLAINVQFLR